LRIRRRRRRVVVVVVVAETADTVSVLVVVARPSRVLFAILSEIGRLGERIVAAAVTNRRLRAV
jgi:hypothetical protein